MPLNDIYTQVLSPYDTAYNDDPFKKGFRDAHAASKVGPAIRFL